ncbi:unnamed protein product, partial [Porites evermanni]
MDAATSENKLKKIAQLRAQQFKIREECITRARSPAGQPVAYQKVKEKSNINRRSRVMSDPDIPGSLVILNAKGLFQGKNGNVSVSNQERHCKSVSKMDKGTTNRPVFCDPSISSKESKVSDLKKRFEAVCQHDIERDKLKSEGEFLNPLHKINQRSNTITVNKLKKPVQKDTEKPLTREAKECDSLKDKDKGDLSNANPLDKVNEVLVSRTDQKSKANIQKKFENVLHSTDVVIKKSTSPPNVNVVIAEPVSAEQLTELEMKKKPPDRPPPRPPKKDPLKRLKSDSNPMPLSENHEGTANLRVQEGESMEEIIQNENEVLQRRSESEGVVNGNNEINSNDENGDDDGDDDDNEWDTDFDDDIDDEEEDRIKRDSQSSQESSGDGESLEFPDAISKKLYNIASEILTTERAYVRRLNLLDQVFYMRLNNECCAKGVIPLEALNDIFSNIQAIHQLHRDFLLPKLEGRMKEWSTNNQIGDILKGLAPFLKANQWNFLKCSTALFVFLQMYTLYVGNFDKATETLSTWTKKSPAMAAVIEEIQKSKECENLTLQHHMLEPVQRVPRYQLLLKDYLSKLPADSGDLKNTSDALEIIAESARHANDSMKKTERFKILLEIQERIGDDYPLITASRELVMEGEFRKVAARTTDSHQERTLMLFNDVLLCCAKFPGTNRYKVKVEMDLYGMEVDSVDEEIEVENAFRITSKQRVMDFTAASGDAKWTFINKIEETINELTIKRESYRRGSKIEVIQEGDLGKKAPAWVRDEAVSMCMLCDVLFTKFRRRHHCRACGRVVCGHCSSFKAALEYKNGKLEKVCQCCHKVLVTGSSEEKAKEAVAKGNSILKIGNANIWQSGYLNFKVKGDKGWQKRWFVLTSEFVLLRYKAKKDSKAESNLPLPGYTVDKPTLADELDRKNVFKMHHKNLRVHFFQAESEESMIRYLLYFIFA